MSRGTTADVDPTLWTIEDGKLYLNLNQDVQSNWNTDRTGYIKKADNNWPGVLTK